MGFIERTYRNTVAFLDSIGASQYAQVASELAVTAQILSAIVVILVLITMGTQTYRIDAGESLALMVKITLIALFLQNWAQFNSVLNALYGLFDGISSSLLQISTNSSEETNFAKELDELSETFGDFANHASGRLNILGAVINGIMWLFMALFGGICTLGLIVSRVALTLLISIAPLAIASLLLKSSKNFFEKWFDGMIMMLIFPVILAGVFATVVAMGNSTIESLEPDSNSLGNVTPVLTMLIMSSIMVLLTPFLAMMLTGSIQLGNAVAGGGKFAASKGTDAAKGTANAGRGLMGGALGNDPSDKAGFAEKAGNRMGGAARDTAGFFKGGKAMEKAQNEGRDRIAQLDRMSDRVNRFAARRKP